MPKVLVVDDEPQIRHILSVMLTERGFEVAEADSGEQALAILDDFNPHVILLDMNMDSMDGLTTLEHIKARNKNIDCIMMTAYGTIRSAVKATRIGAFDYLTKPFDNEEMLLIVNRAIEMRRLSSEVDELRAELSSRYGFNEIVGISPKLQSVFHTMKKVASVDATVLIEGESGTGKELVARALHRHSRRAQGPFLAVNCGAVPGSLFEAEFFGHERGAFTDAHRMREGYFEQAQGGSLFLDEIGELPQDAQVKLLRALQNSEVTRLGGRNPIKINTRIIAATNLDLRAAVKKERFREDLFWRLNVVKIVLPSLRERREDLPLLIDSMMERFNRELSLSVHAIAPEARGLLTAYDWPGNVRELENAICSAMIMSEGGQIRVCDLPMRIRAGLDGVSADPNSSAESSGDSSRVTLASAVNEAAERVEKAMIIMRLAEMRGNRTNAAESLGISRKSLFNKMRQYGLSAGEVDKDV